MLTGQAAARDGNANFPLDPAAAELTSRFTKLELSKNL